MMANPSDKQFEPILDECIKLSVDCPDRLGWPCGKRSFCDKYLPVPLTDGEKLILGVK